MKPFLKWAGGKTQLLEKLIAQSPPTYTRYVELMVGGGARFFASDDKPALLCDVNADLIATYEQVRDGVDSVIESLQSLSRVCTKEEYYRIRSLSKEAGWMESSTPADRAARFIYLNKLCYNGLYRVNSSGHFNVPYGKKDEVNFDYDNLHACSVKLQSAGLLVGSFEATLPFLNADDFVYIDPPYLPTTITAKFTEYTRGGFALEQHRRLKAFCDILHEREIKFMLSNSHQQTTLDMYSAYNISVVFARRNIAANGARRGPTPEVIVTNYQ